MINIENEQPNIQNKQNDRIKNITGVISQVQNILTLKTLYKSSTKDSSNIKKQVKVPYNERYNINTVSIIPKNVKVITKKPCNTTEDIINNITNSLTQIANRQLNIIITLNHMKLNTLCRYVTVSNKSIKNNQNRQETQTPTITTNSITKE